MAIPTGSGLELLRRGSIITLTTADTKLNFAGAITAALFLNRFVTNNSKFVHFDCYGWQPTASPARPKGGTGQGIRALFQALPEILDL